ncbi:MAG: hypothetical protein M3R27_10835 [Bacteroidota bacterium]|nr:hypothetical protein [Bacteroidota bacterium]
MKSFKSGFLIVSVLILLVSLYSFRYTSHKFYLGLAEVRVDTKKHTMDVSCKLFRDDLENALQKRFGKKFVLDGFEKNKADQKEIKKYLEENFKINVGGKLQTLSFVGYEAEEESVWIYLETDPFNSKGTVTLLNTLLYDLLPDQVNMINFHWDGVSKTAKLSNPDKMVEFIF